MLELDTINGLRKSRISELCDDLIILIISFLPIKEAICTSLLSYRWRHLWKYTTGSWRFNLCEFYEKFEGTNYFEYQKWWKKAEKYYAKRVNQTLKSHRAPFLYELAFRLHPNWCDNFDCTKVIRNWIRIASRKCVRRLDLHIPWFSFGKCVENVPIFSHLTHLTLDGVGVSEEILLYIISSSPLLEYLCVMNSYELVKLKLVGGAKLKHFEISSRRFLESFEISAPNLVTFVGQDLCTTPHLKDVPLLSKLSLASFDGPNLKIIEPLSYLSQIESLTLELEYLNVASLHDLELSSLKHLDLGMRRCPIETCFLPYTWLIKASPLLSTLKIKFEMFMSLSHLTKKREELLAPGSWRKCHTHEATIIYPHQCLRVVTLCGFSALQRDNEFALHVIEMATSLEKIVVDCSDSWNEHSKSCREERRIARERAEELRSKLSASTEFVVLYS